MAAAGASTPAPGEREFRMAKTGQGGDRQAMRGDSLAPLLQWMAEQAQRQPAPSYASLDDWWAQFRRMRERWPVPIDQALAGGVLADRIGYAFAAGYQAALHRLDAALPLDRLASFSVTEEGGAHPRAIESTLRPGEGGKHAWILSGRKKWATLSSDGGIAIVVASTGKGDSGRNLLRAVRVDLGSPGVGIERMPPPPFVPEIPHCRLRFDSVGIADEQLLPGDGYADYAKPFRTLEDTHVTAAVLAYVLALSFRYDWPRSLREELLHLIVSARGLALADPTSAAVHIALQGLFSTRHRLLEAAAPCWEHVDPDVRQRWERDAGLVQVAGNARNLRLERAWEQLSVE